MKKSTSNLYKYLIFIVLLIIAAHPCFGANPIIKLLVIPVYNLPFIAQIHISPTLLFATIAVLILIFLGIIGLSFIINRLKTSIQKQNNALTESEKKFRTLFEFAADAIFVIDPDSNLIVDANLRAQGLAGRTLTELKKMKHGEFFTSASYETVLPYYKETLAGIRSAVHEAEFIDRSGKKIPVEISAEAVAVNNSKKLYLGIFRDITYRKFAEKALIESEERYKTLVDQSPNPIAVINSARQFIYFNNAALSVFGLDNQNDILGHDVMEIIHADSLPDVTKQLQNLDMGIGNGPSEIKLIRADGKVFHTMTSSLPITLSGEPAILIVSHDITEYKKVQDALALNEMMLKQQNEEYITVNEELLKSNQRIQQINLELIKSKDKAEESDRLKSSFLANMSHEIRTPMNGILGFSELLLKPNLPAEKLYKYVQLINHNGHRLLAIINDIVDISKLESGQVNIHLLPTNLNNLINDLKILLEPQVLEKGLTLSEVSPLSGEQADILVDEPHLKHILMNLLYNALKFTDKGFIRFGYKLKNEFIEFFVKDTGIGISPENHKIIFERFRQVEPDDPRKVSGTGLGLSISKAFIELMGGSIWVNSDLGKGSEFCFTIPYIPQNAILLDNKEVLLVKKYNWSQKTILVVEDDDTNFTYIDEILSVTYAQVIRATNGADAIEIVNNHDEICLVLMDLKLPLVDGFVATRMIKHQHPNLPVIAQTAYAMADDKTKAMNAGCDDYLSKPLDKNELLNKIENQFKRIKISV